jgi:quinol monooxygenase YgiN
VSLTIIAKLVARPGAEESLRSALNDMVEPSLAEEGCLAYEPYVDPVDPCRMVIVEEWTDAAALEEHFNTPHFQQVAKVLEDVLAQPSDLRRLTPVD